MLIMRTAWFYASRTGRLMLVLLLAFKVQIEMAADVHDAHGLV